MSTTQSHIVVQIHKREVSHLELPWPSPLLGPLLYLLGSLLELSSSHTYLIIPILSKLVS